ncbi:MAG: hypothetical protein GC189_10260 [Alphaproteobacteria bacterium]|nr:hypothetical protein [Alphaproteobacteria bacterium]
MQNPMPAKDRDPGPDLEAALVADLSGLYRILGVETRAVPRNETRIQALAEEIGARRTRLERVRGEPPPHTD